MRSPLNQLKVLRDALVIPAEGALIYKFQHTPCEISDNTSTFTAEITGIYVVILNFEELLIIEPSANFFHLAGVELADYINISGFSKNMKATECINAENSRK